MSQFTRRAGYNGLAVPDDRVTPAYWATQPADMQESGPKPGQAIPADGGAQGIVKTHGAQGDTTYTVEVSRGGFGSDAGFVWYQSTNGVNTAKRGWNSPNFAQDTVFVGGGVSTDELTGTPAVVTMSSGRMVWLYTINNTAHSPATYAVCATFTDLFSMDDITGPDGSIILAHSDSTGAVYDPANYYGATPHGLDCVCARWDDARSVIQCWIRMVGVRSAEFQFFLFESADAVTWTLVQRDCSSQTFTESETLRPPSVACANGCTTIIQPDNDNVAAFYVRQFVSYDGGKNFTQPFGLVTTDYQEVALVEHRGGVVAAARNGTTDAVHTGRLTSLYHDFSAQTLTDIEAPASGFDLSLAVAYGRVWLAMIDADGLQVKMLTSTTGDSYSWITLGYDPLTFESAASGVASNYIKIQPGLGGLILTLAPTGSSVPDFIDGHLVAIRLGGWASVTLPMQSDANGDFARIAFGPLAGLGSSPYDGAAYYPLTLPEDLDRSGTPIWTYSSSGAPTAPSVDATLTNGFRLKAPLSAAGSMKSHRWYSDFDGDIDTGVMVYFDGNVSAATNNDTALTVTVFDGTQLWGCVLVLGPGASAIFTDYTGADSVTLDDVTTRYQYMMAIRRAMPSDTDAVATLYRSTRVTIADRFGWELVGSITCSTTPSAAAAGVRVNISHGGDGAATYTSNLLVYALHYRAYCGLYLADDLATQPALGDYLIGAPCCSTPSELSDGFKVSFTAGPVTKGDTFTIPPRYDFAKEHLYPTLYPSPRIGWRSQEDNIDLSLSWQFNPDSATEGFDTSSLCIAMFDTNIRFFTVEGLTDTGIWEALADVQTSDEFASLEYRAGAAGGLTAPYIVPATTSPSATRYIHENELAGGWVSIATGGGGFARVNILRNTAGEWSSNTTAGKKPRLYLDRDQWSSAAIPDTGTMDIIPPRVMVVKHGLGNTEYAAIRVIIPAQYTADEFYRIGTLFIGPVYVFGKNYSFGRVVARKSNTTLSTSLGGIKNPVVNGPTSRYVQFGWFEGIDSSDLYDAAGAPDYVTVSADTGSAHAVAARYDLATQLDGLYERLNGEGTAVLYIAKIPFCDDPAAAYVTTNREDFMLGRVVTPLERQTVKGEESRSEISTIASITVDEEA